MKRTESEKETSKSRSTSTKPAPKSRKPSTTISRFVVCVKNGGHVDLEPRKLYEVRADATAKADGLTRVVDDSGEDYLYPADFFRPIRVPRDLLTLIQQVT